MKNSSTSTLRRTLGSGICRRAAYSRTVQDAPNRRSTAVDRAVPPLVRSTALRVQVQDHSQKHGRQSQSPRKRPPRHRRRNTGAPAKSTSVPSTEESRNTPAHYSVEGMAHRWEPPHRLLPRQCGPLPLSMPLIWTHSRYLADAYLAPLTKRLFVWIPAFAGMTKTPSCPRKRAPIIFTLGHWPRFVRHSKGVALTLLGETSFCFPHSLRLSFL